MAIVAIKIWSQVAQRNEDMTGCSMLPVISFGIIFTIYGNVTRNHLKRKADYQNILHAIFTRWSM